MGVKSDNNKNLDLNLCPECCGNIINVQQKAEQVCSQCGLVINERMIDFEHLETRAFDREEVNKKVRTGPPTSPLFSKLALPTIISKSLSESPDFKRLIKRNNHEKWELRNQIKVFSEMRRICKNKGISENIYNSAAKLYLEVLKRKITRGRSIIGIASACLYYCCKKEGYPITIKEIAEDTTPIRNNEASTFKHIKKCFIVITKELGLSSYQKDPNHYIPKFVSELGLDPQVERLAIKLLHKIISSSLINGKNPCGYAASSIYLVCRTNNIKITQKELEKVSGVTDATLRARIKELQKRLYT